MLIILYLRLLIFLVVSIPLVHPLSTTSFVSIKRPFTDLPMNVVEGSIPKWLKGDYIRNGPGLFEAGNKRLNHLFDGYGMLVKVAFDPSSPPQVSTRFIESDAYRAAAAGKMAYPEFGTTRNWEEDAGFMEKVQAFIQVISGDPTDNAVVNVLRLGDGTQVRLHLERSGELAMSEERVKQVGERSCIALAIASLQPPFALGALCSNINIGNKSRAGSCSCTRRVCLLRNHGNHSRPLS